MWGVFRYCGYYIVQQLFVLLSLLLLFLYNIIFVLVFVVPISAIIVSRALYFGFVERVGGLLFRCSV